MILLTVNTLGGIARFITVLVLFVVVLWVTWAVTKWTGSYQKGKWAGGNIEMLESFRIASDKYVQIIRVADKYIAIAVSKDNVTFLAQIEESELVRRDEPDGGSKLSFQELLEKVREKKRE